MKENCKLDKKQHITDAEWEVMRVVWANSEVTSKFVAEVLCEKMNWKQATIKTLLNRLLEKNILKKREIGNKYIYSTDFTEKEVANSYILGTFDKICKTKVGEMIGKVIENSELSFSDLDLILKTVEEKKKTAVKEVLCDCVEGQCNCEHNGHKHI
ncbi:CopY family transcriptional regulator [Leptotrichia trevisanii]|uniref:CopY family transcriptional regulator n=1 Tax=Leptotrichia trevisanii TaxID=109328 RepID=A0A510K2Q7_9FUSO|nr:CopY/TcrY family copper transport repressor [Leptotrichia trevisanii]BBM45784.1 CopY family transcriptional regulator [Leptotrichia trevisanii]BBM57789.1 CopY family transcriptional regulator [Leptotrichia trevisanii]